MRDLFPSRGWRGGVALRVLLALLLGTLACTGCGGGGGNSAPAGIDLGTVARTVPTEVLQPFTNPLSVPATVSEPAPGTSFRIRSGVLPLAVAAGGTASLPVLCTPGAAGPFSGSITLLWQADGSSQTSSVAFRATAEVVRLVATPPLLVFGTLAAGATHDLALSVLNPRALSPVTLSSVQVTAPGLSVLGSLPATLLPGASLALTVRATSASGGPLEDRLVLGPTDVGAALPVPVAANLPARQDVTDFGDVPFTGLSTALLSVFVPADAISLTLEALASSEDETLGLYELTGPGGKVYEASDGSGSYVWAYSQQVFTAQVPNTDRPGLQLVPGGGTYTFRLRRTFNGSTAARVRTIVERRPGGTSSTGLLPLNVWLVPAASTDAAGAPTDPRMQQVLAEMDTILRGQGIQLGDVDFYDVTDSRFNMVSEQEFPELLKLSSAASEVRVNLFFVQQALGGGVVGVAGMIGGPQRNGTRVSGVMTQFDGYSAAQTATIASHEVGHLLGLYHTVEETGAHDFIDDTDECPAYGIGGGCSETGGGYLMHWLVTGGRTITPGQGRVLRGHPLVAPLPDGPSAKPLGPPPPPAPLAPLVMHPGWCGTCARAGQAAR
ncbi:MAG: M12 family metallo-peptidase [Planctomycetia bacterium]